MLEKYSFIHLEMSKKKIDYIGIFFSPSLDIVHQTQRMLPLQVTNFNIFAPCCCLLDSGKFANVILHRFPLKTELWTPLE
jgi:hypothetical protein